MEDIIYNTPNEELQQRGLNLQGNKMRQVNLMGYGIIDLLVWERDYVAKRLNIKVIELKKDQIDKDALSQLIRYLRGVQRYLEFRNVNNYVLSGLLIGSEVSLGDFVFLTDLIAYTGDEGYLQSLEYMTFKYEFDGIHFEDENGYYRKKEGWRNE